MKAKVIVGMSGGVDSSVAAWILQEQGYQVEGMFMKNWEQDDSADYCAAAKDLEDAKSVCARLDIPFHAINFSKEYWDNVFVDFLSEYEQGRTPNPDVLCNKEIKFKVFLHHALNLGADYVATGHYAKILFKDKQPILCKSKDREKDQSYFLHAIDPEILPKVLFPLGDYCKKEVRDTAQELGFVTHDKKDSTGICFIGEKRFKEFLKEYLLPQPGEIKNTLGVSLGKHEGLMFYTLGQRKGLGLGGGLSDRQDPWYVVDKEIETNTLIVAQGYDHPRLYSQALICGPIHWLDDCTDQLPLTCQAKTRYRQTDQACLISPEDNNKHYVMFSNPQRAVTPGQYVVFYQGNQCLGGAIIEGIIRI